jgi:phosphonate transport system substrate-binding protein
MRVIARMLWKLGNRGRFALSVGCCVMVLMFAQAASALADWREETGVFRIGIAARAEPVAAAAGAEPFRLALEEKLAMPVEIVPLRDYSAIAAALAASRLEYAVISSFAYATAWVQCECVEPLVIPRGGDGITSYSMVLVTGPQGPGSLSSLSGARVAAIRSRGFGGVDLALSELRQAGLPLAFPTDDDASGSVQTLQSFDDGEAAILAFLDGQADAILGWSTLTGDPSSGYSRGTLSRIAELRGSATGYRVLWKSSPIPQRVHAVRQNLAGEAKTLLRELLSGMFSADPVAYDSIEPIFGGGFVSARHGQFEALLPLIAQMKTAPEAGAAE